MSPKQSKDPSIAVCAAHRFEVMAGSFQTAACLAVARVLDEPESHETLATTWLRPGELDRYRRFLVDTARRDFLAGRIAAKSALQALIPTSSAERDWEIVSGTWQRPAVRGSEDGFAITLAHAGGTGVALAFDDRWVAGIDIESTQRVATSTIESHVTSAEAAWARAAAGTDAADTEGARWLALWTAREAFGKLLGTGLGLPEALLPVVAWEPLGRGWTASLAGNSSFSLQTVIGREFVVSIASPSGSITPEASTHLSTWLSDTLGP